MRAYLCQSCAGNDEHCISLAGIQRKCDICGRYAHAYYEKTWDGWEPKTIAARDGNV